MHGGDLVAEVLKAHGVRFLFTLCGGHISPILVGCKRLGIRVIDVRNEATAVFAADAASRLSGVPGVAAVTAGPGVTNTITAIQNAKMAQSAVVILGGAAATALKGRGALQDIDQISVVKSIVKWATVVKRVRDLAPTLQRAFHVAQSGVPGPVFVECPIDLLYDEALVREWYGLKSQHGRSLADRALKLYLRRHVNRLFANVDTTAGRHVMPVRRTRVADSVVKRAASELLNSKKPLMLIGSQTMAGAHDTQRLVQAVETLGIPVYLSGMARGLLGSHHPLHMRHKRRDALKEADLVLLCGVPCDFRLDYGRHIRRSSHLISVNMNRAELKLNRRPDQAILGNPADFIIDLARSHPPASPQDWLTELRSRDDQREAEIEQQASVANQKINPLKLCQQIEAVRAARSLMVADGGDFVGTASYILRPPGPLTWLDPGVFGTLGVGAGFAMAAKLLNPEAEVWIIFGDGSVGYSLSEFDTFARHNIGVIAVVGNDASWAQIAREQVHMLGDEVGTVLRHSDYHLVAEGLGGKGLNVDDPAKLGAVLQRSKETAASGVPVLVNAHIDKTDFRKGSLSM